MTSENEVDQAFHGIIHPGLKIPCRSGHDPRHHTPWESQSNNSRLETNLKPSRKQICGANKKTVKELPGITWVAVNITTLSQNELEQLFSTPISMAPVFL